MAYDSGRSRLVLFGGTEEEFAQPADTWEFDGANWIDVTPDPSPPARFTSAMVFDSARSRIVMFGGASVADDVWSWLNDTWEYGNGL